MGQQFLSILTSLILCLKHIRFSPRILLGKIPYEQSTDHFNLLLVLPSSINASILGLNEALNYYL